MDLTLVASQPVQESSNGRSRHSQRGVESVVATFGEVRCPRTCVVKLARSTARWEGASPRGGRLLGFDSSNVYSLP